MGTHEKRDYAGCSFDTRSYNYANVTPSDDRYYSMWEFGMEWKGPYTFKAGETKTLNTEMDLLTGELRNDMSIVTWSSSTKIVIKHSDEIESDDGWSVQVPASTEGPQCTDLPSGPAADYDYGYLPSGPAADYDYGYQDPGVDS